MALFNRRDRFAGHGVDFDEPLCGEPWLDDGTAALRCCHRQGVLFDVNQQAERVQVGQDTFPRGVPLHAVVGRTRQIDVRGLVHDG